MISRKAVLIFCAATLPAGMLLTQGLSPEAQRAAEELLRKKMDEAQGTPKIKLPSTAESATPAAPAAPAVPAAAAKPAPAPAAPSTATQAQMKSALDKASGQSTLSSDTENRARTLLREKMAESAPAPQPVAQPQVAQPQVARPQVTQPAAPRTVTAPPPPPSNLPRNQVLAPPTGPMKPTATVPTPSAVQTGSPTLSPDAEARARAMLQQKLVESAQPAPTTVAPPQVAQPPPAPAPATKPTVTRTFTPPPPPSGNLPRNQVLVPPTGPRPPAPVAVERPAPRPQVGAAAPAPGTPVYVAPPPATQPAPKPVVTAPAAAPIPGAKPVVTATPPPALPSSLSPDAEARARAALEQTMAQPAPQPKAAVAATPQPTRLVAPSSAPTPKPAPATKTAATPKPTPTVVATPKAETKPQAKAATQPPAKTKAAEKPVKTAVAESAAPKAAVPGPKFDLPISQTKWQRLADLTSLYMSDKITPHEYHQRRAEIIAEP